MRPCQAGADPRFFVAFRWLIWLPVAIVSFTGVVSAEEPAPGGPAKRDLASAQPKAAQHSDPMCELQTRSSEGKVPVYGHWGVDASKYSSWTDHSNRLVPVYTFGLTLSDWRERGSVYADADRLKVLDRSADESSVNPTAMYYDQVDVYQLQQAAIDAGYSNIILILFDGMDWQTSRAAAIYKTGRIAYESGRGTGLAFQDDRRTQTDFGLLGTSAAAEDATTDVDAQRVISVSEKMHFGYDVRLGGRTPWDEHNGSGYFIGADLSRPHTVTDSAASATTLCSGIKTYNGAINVALDGSQVVPIARQLQRDQDFMVGVVTSVPVSHATSAAAYANNVSRKDYQDLSRDLIGLASASHRNDPLPGVDVLLGGGWGEHEDEDEKQGMNFAQGNPYLHEDDLHAADLQNGGNYRVVQRTPGKSGRKLLRQAAQAAADNQERLLGFFGTKGGHLPYATADGGYDPTTDVNGAEQYTDADVTENPTLADMTEAALLVLEQSIDGFWLMIEAGDVDWANHANNLDNSIGAVLSGEAAFVKVMDWVDENNAWDHTAVIVTADHGHYLVLDRPEAIAAAGRGERE
ncbi:Alkaline phosphatase 4 precursor [Stieleria maiorica]|uniref:Alkaline phosphatase 4 n=1 Tax=Stieleria maiorica TaxID=2795974 RepID=A0A5B9MJX8_9BACT|nr:alkaline phosphatase [Stieleria maiorica]QEF99974.1 Alkaline phosphatase 4 precursor [Stieleria maiorica]